VVTEEQKLNERAWKGEVRASGSDMWANALCEGRFLADQSFPEKDNDAATAGSRMHSFMEHGTPLMEIEDDNDRYAVSKARKMEERLLDDFKLNGKVEREPRLWCVEDGDGKFSGCIDRLEVDGKRASIIDYKMLYGQYPSARKNKQLQVYAALVFENYPEVEACYLGLIQPLLDKVTKAKVTRKSAMKLRGLLVELSDKIKKEGADRTPGHEQCKWCAALAHCPDAYRFLVERLTRDEDMESVSNDELAEKLADVQLFDRFIKEVKGLARERLEKDIDVPGYQLRRTGKITTFNAAKAGQILFDANLTVEQFLKCCTIKEPKLVAEWAELTGQTKAEARKDLRLRLENCMTQRAKAKSVAAV
tara:strand:+ start:334 stop:1422 length:1089 start_codon:yes stop_codon:yes gene_type:complete